MHNEILTIGPFTVYGYGLMIAIGIIAAYFMAEHLAQKRGVNKDHIFGLVMFALIFGFLGAKILYILTRLGDLGTQGVTLADLADGWVIYGGILGGIVGIFAASKVYGEKVSDFLDIAVPAVALAQGFGRIGCFLAGCCYGIEYDGIFSITFHTSNYAPNDVALFPTQLLSSGLNFLHFALLYILFMKVKRRGIVVGTYLTCYSIGRFLVEFLRGDLERGTVGDVSTSQFIAFFVALAGVIVLFYSCRKGSIVSFAAADVRTEAFEKEPQTHQAEPAEDTEEGADDSECSEDL